MGRKLGRSSIQFLERGAGSPSNTIPWTGAYLHTKWHMDACSRLATIEMCQNWGGSSAPFLWRGLGLHLTQSRLVRAYLHAKCHLDPSSSLATINMGRNFRGFAPFLGRGAGSPSNTKSPGPRPTTIGLASGILIHTAIWLQQIWVENWGGGCAPLRKGS